jgi:hypothetical protein
MRLRARERSVRGRQGRPRTARYRVATYIVISNPNRMSTNSGFIQTIIASWHIDTRSPTVASAIILGARERAFHHKTGRLPS